MRIYFSPHYKFKDIDWNNKDRLIDAFEDRVLGFYLNPAETLNSNKENCFAAGLSCIAAIDFLARITLDENSGRIQGWLRENVADFHDNNARDIFYKYFRNGLVHEGRIKNCGQFTYDISGTAHFDRNVMLVNPRNLLNDIKLSFRAYLGDLKCNEEKFEKFKKQLISDFKKEIELTSR